MTKVSIVIALLSVVLAAVGCKPDGRYDVGLTVTSVDTLESGLVVRETGLGRLLYLEPTATTLTVNEFYRADDDERFMWSTVGPDTEAPTEYFQMTVPVDERDPDLFETLHRFSFAGGVTTLTSYTVHSPFNGFVFGPDQEFAILYHTEDQDSSQYDVFNPNEVAVLDLTAPPSDTNPSIMSVDLNGHRITGVSFLETLKVGPVERKFAVFMAEGVIRLLDLNSPEDTIRIRLTTDEDPREVIPKQVIARDSDATRNPMIFVRATDSEDIYAITIAHNSGGEVGFMATMNQFESNGTPKDMVHVQDGPDPLLIVLSSGSSSVSGRSIFNMVNIDTSSSFTMITDDKAKKLYKRETDEGEQVVAYGDDTDRVTFVEIEGVIEEREHNMEDVEVPDGIDKASVLDDTRILILSESNTDIILLNLDTQKTTRFSAPSLTSDDWNSAQIMGDWFYFLPGNGDRIGLVDLTTDHPDSLILDDIVNSLHLIKSSNMGVCIHPATTGRVTVFPLNNPIRAAAFVIEGLWISGFLNESEGN